MNSLYKRVITLGMVSVTALLAWVYCIVTFPKQLVYLAAISLVVVVSLYALLNALTGLRIEKENKLQAYFRQTTNEIVEKALEAGDTEESIRLAKASYVQIRRTSTNLKSLLEQGEQNAAAVKEQHDETCTLIADSINKATKIVVKYNGNNSNKLLEIIDTLSSQVAELKLEMSSADGNETVTDNIDYTGILNDILGKLDTLKINVTQESYDLTETVDVSPDVSEVISSDSDEENDDTDDTDDTAEGMALAQGMIDAFLGGDEKPTQEVEDPGKKLSADEIAALFEASKEERKAESDDDFKVEDHPDAMDQGLIDALLSLDENEDADKNTEAAKDSKVADVIPFPNSEPEPVAEAAPVSEDPNKQLSADEIAALFAAASPAESEPEPVAPAPVAEDPGRQLTPDEIAALFSSMSG